MNVFVNNKPQAIAQHKSISGLLTTLALAGTKGIAVAINQTIISKTEWDNHILKENDHIMIIRATQGG
jgi:sulfur carrier protein